MWKDIEGYEGKYEVSDKGEIRSTLPDGRTRILKGSRNWGNGVKRVSLSKNSVTENCSVRQLVANHFLESDEDKPYLVNINGDNGDCSVENIERSELNSRQYERRVRPKKYDKTWHTSVYSADNNFKV